MVVLKFVCLFSFKWKSKSNKSVYPTQCMTQRKIEDMLGLVLSICTYIQVK